MSNSVPAPKFHRSWTRIRDYSSERAFRQLIRQHDLSHVPTILLKQFAQLGVRATQYNRKIRELEEEAEENAGQMDAQAWARWTFLVTEYRRCALAIATLAKLIFGEQHQRPAIDLVAMMAQQPDAVETVEPEQPPESDQ